MARRNNPHQEEDACFEAVMHWRSGNTTVAISWVGLLRALRSAGLCNVADSIEMQNGVETVSACDYVCTNCTYMKLRYILIFHLTQITVYY